MYIIDQGDNTLMTKSKPQGRRGKNLVQGLPLDESGKNNMDKTYDAKIKAKVCSTKMRPASAVPLRIWFYLWPAWHIGSALALYLVVAARLFLLGHFGVLPQHCLSLGFDSHVQAMTFPGLCPSLLLF